MLSVFLGVVHTFFEQDIIAAMVGISSASIFYYLYRNQEILMAKSWDEFGELFDNSRDKKYLWGFPALQAILLASILYIWLV